MIPRRTRLAGAALLTAALATPAFAESFASSASSAGSASSGSLSDSIQGSSNSSSPNKTVADGEYRIDGIAAVAQKPGFVRLQLQDVARADNTLFLDLPEPTAAQAALALGGRVSARNRPYGIEFAKAPVREAFFLVLADDWYRELPSHPVSL
jgi:hypothetical protein